MHEIRVGFKRRIFGTDICNDLVGWFEQGAYVVVIPLEIPFALQIPLDTDVLGRLDKVYDVGVKRTTTIRFLLHRANSSRNILGKD